MDISCAFCQFDFELSQTRCPHCGQPQLFPNVTRASQRNEIDSLKESANAVFRKAKKKGTKAAVEKFAEALLASEAALSCSLQSLNTLVSHDYALYATIYGLTDVTITNRGTERETERRRAEVALFGDKNAGKIRFAVLSLDGRGPSNYGNGECTIQLRTDMIRHRASVFVENNVLYYQKHYRPTKPYPGLGVSATWENRHLLGIAKLGESVHDAMGERDFAALVVRNGATKDEDDFLEVHIFDTLTRRTFKKIVVHSWDTRLRSTIKKIRDLTKDVVPLEVPQ
jgi:hypothetical protein